MKRIISITIALCLVFCSVLPVYAEAWTSNQANQVTQSVIGILSQLANLDIHFQNWATLLGNGNAPAYFHSFQDLYNRIDWALSWIVPDTLHGQTDPTIMDTLVVLSTYAMNHLPDISVIAGYVGSWMSNNLSYLNSLRLALTNYYAASINGTTWNWQAWRQNAHQYLSSTAAGSVDQASQYQIPTITGLGSYVQTNVRWDHGTPIGNIALMLQKHMNNDVTKYNLSSAAFFTHYNDTLTTWDSQGNTLTQVTFSPVSAIQGLYRYLAFTQRDVARLAYVFANDEELEARVLAQANQEQVLDDFIDPNGTGAVSTTDLGSMADASGSFKDNFDTGQSASGIWNVFDRDYDWFSQTTANNLQPSLTRGSEEYSTPYLDEYYKELDNILEVNKRD